MVCIPNTKETIHPSIYSVRCLFNSAYDTGAGSRTEPHSKNSIDISKRENNFFPPFLTKRLKKLIEKEKHQLI